MYTDEQLDQMFDLFMTLDDYLTEISYDRELGEHERLGLISALYSWRDALLDAEQEHKASRLRGRIHTLGYMVCQLIDEHE